MCSGISEPRGVGGVAYASPSDFLHLVEAQMPRRVVCASTRSDASMAALMRAAAARRGRIEGWDIGTGGAGAGGWRNDGGASPLCSI